MKKLLIVLVVAIIGLTGCKETKADGDYLPPLSDCVSANTKDVQWNCKNPVIKKNKPKTEVNECTFPTKACQEKAKKKEKK